MKNSSSGSRRWALITFLCAQFGLGIAIAKEPPAEKPLAQTPTPHILMLAVDDLNHWVGHLDGHPGTLTPNIDRLAADGVAFTRSYSAAPVCNPSRISLLTGVSPAHSGVYGNAEKFRD